jgi:hypothetical protein
VAAGLALGGVGVVFLSGNLVGYFLAAFYLSAARSVVALEFAPGFGSGFFARPAGNYFLTPVLALAYNFLANNFSFIRSIFDFFYAKAGFFKRTALEAILVGILAGKATGAGAV